MKYKVSLLLTLFAVIEIYSQQIAVPYRDGSKWGVSDVTGNIIIPTLYDSVSFDKYDQYNQEILYTELKGKKGIVVKGIEIFKPEFLSIVIMQNLYIATKEVNNQYELHVADQTGKEVLDNSYVLLRAIKEVYYYTKVTTGSSSSRSKQNYVVVFSLINRDNKKSVAVWDVQQNKITQWLYKDYYSIVDPVHYDSSSLLYRYKLNENSAIQEQIFRCKDGQFELVPSIKKGVVSETIIANQNSASGYAGSGSGTGKGPRDRRRVSSKGSDLGADTDRVEMEYDNQIVVESPSIKGDSDSYISVVPPPDTAIKEQPKEYISKSVEFRLVNSKILFQTTQNRNYRIKGVTEVSLKGKITDLKLVNIGYTEIKSTKADTIFNYKNFVTYRNGAKYGVLIGDDSSRTIEYDTLIVKQYTSHLEFKGKLSFIVGNKDKKTHKYKYGIMDSNLELKFPLVYDQIIDNSPHGGEDFNQWTAILDGKYGIINPNGTVLLPSEYDEIISKKNSFGRNVFLQLKKGNQYGVYIRERDKKIEIYPALYPYPIDKIYFNYPFQRDGFSELTNEQKEQSIMLFSLTNEQGKLMGYANKNGTFYFKN